MSTPDDRGYRVLAPSDVTDAPTSEFANAVLEGLSERPKRLPSRFIYDDLGSEYFQQIMSLEEYYPTRCEAELLTNHAGDILAQFQGAQLNLVDLGAGDGKKTIILLRKLVELGIDFQYVPVDISEGAMQEVTQRVRAAVPEAKLAGIVADYTTGLRWLAKNSLGQRNLVLFLGSNIGNFNRASARVFLRKLWSALNPDDQMLIGFDLKKDIDKLLHAYNDSEGVTAKFNCNLLHRINRELGGDFDVELFRHYATYDVFSGAMESYLVSLATQKVRVDALETEFEFDAWEPIHTEYSYKYLTSDILQLATDTGFAIETDYFDSNKWFAGSQWRVVKN